MTNVLTNLNSQDPLVSFAGNHLGDDVRTGNVYDFYATTSATNGLQGTLNASGAPGVLNAPPGWMYLTPIKEPGLADAGASASLMTSQIVAAGGQLPLRGISSGVLNANFRLAMVGGIPMIQLDCARSIILHVAGVGANAPFNLSVSGADFWGQRMTVTITVPLNLAASKFYDSFKSFRYISSASVTAGTTVAVWLGVGPTFGLDYYTPTTGFLIRGTYQNANLDLLTSVNAGADGHRFIPPPLLTDAPSATTKDVRGSIILDPDSTSGGETMTNLAPLTLSYIISGGTAQVGWTYSLASNTWAPTAKSLRVANILGAPQYYSAALSP